MALFLDCSPQTVTLEGTRRQLTFTRFPGHWIYCNYPERLPADGSALGDKTRGNHYLNQVLVDGPAQAFAAYVNQMPYQIYFGLQLYNPGTTSVTATLANNGHRHSGQYPDWCDVEGGVWADFFANNPRQLFTVGPKKAVWLVRNRVPAGKFFSSLVRFQTSGPLWCFPYVFTALTRLDGTATCYPWNPDSGQYRGEGDSYFLSAQADLRISELPTYWTSHACNWDGTNEMIPIVDHCSGLVHACDNGANLGNWGAQYLYQVTITNDDDRPRTVDFFVGAYSQGTTGYSAVVWQGAVKWCCPGSDRWWNFLSDTLGPGESRTYEYQHIQLANATNPAAMQIKVRP